MPIPFVAPIAAGLGKLGLGALGRAAAGKVATKAGGALVKSIGSAGAKKAAGSGFKRMAGDAFKQYMGGPVNAGNVFANFGPDAFFGVLQGVTTPGDLGDKIIAGSTAAAGGALGGVAGTVGLGKVFNKGKIPEGGLRVLGEFGGGFGGDMVGQAVGDVALRIKGGGTTPFEKVQQSQDQEYRKQIEREILASLGLGGYQPSDLVNRDRLM